MTAFAIHRTRFWTTLRSLFAVAAIGTATLAAGSPAHAQILGNEPSRLVTIQGGGLMFLDATAPDRYNAGLNVVTSPANGPFTQSQQWLIASGGNGVYTIQQRSSGMFLDAHEVAGERFEVVLRTRQTQDSTQLWRIVDYGGGFVTFQQVSSGRFVEATADPARGLQVVTGVQGSQLQEWRLGAPF